MKTTNSTTKKLNIAFKGATFLSIAAYIAYAVIGIVFYKKLGRYPSFSEYLSMIFGTGSSGKFLRDGFAYISDPQIIISLLFGTRLFLFGLRYKKEQDDNNLFVSYSALAGSLLLRSVGTLVGFPVFFINIIEVLAVISAAASIIFSFKLFRSAYRRSFLSLIFVELFRLIGLPLAFEISEIGIGKIIGFGLAFAFLVAMLSAAGDTSGSSASSCTVDNSKNRAKLLNQLDVVNNRMKNRQHALNEHNKGSWNYVFVDNKATSRAISDDQREIEMLEKELGKL